jgi:hypothetical protein
MDARHPKFGRQLRVLYGIVCSLAFLTFPVYARVERINIEIEFRRSHAVLLVQIDDQETLDERGTYCGTRYTARVHQSFKNTFGLHQSVVTFGRHVGLERGRQYVLFLRFIADPDVEYQNLKEQHGLPEQEPKDKEVTINSMKCHGIVPGLVYDIRIAWEVDLGYVLISGIRPDLPDSIRADHAGNLQWLIKQDDLLSYLRTLG